MTVQKVCEVESTVNKFQMGDIVELALLLGQNTRFYIIARVDHRFHFINLQTGESRCGGKETIKDLILNNTVKELVTSITLKGVS